MEQLLIHLLADIGFQSDWMALNKSKNWKPCLVHVIIYTMCFLLLTTSWKALLVIGGTHFLIDRFHTPLKRLIWLRNHLNPKMEYPNFGYCNSTGYYDDSPYNTLNLDQSENSDEKCQKSFKEYHIETYGPPRHFFITMWLYIICDNSLHLTINYFALKYLS